MHHCQSWSGIVMHHGQSLSSIIVVVVVQPAGTQGWWTNDTSQGTNSLPTAATAAGLMSWSSFFSSSSSSYTSRLPPKYCFGVCLVLPFAVCLEYTPALSCMPSKHLAQCNGAAQSAVTKDTCKKRDVKSLQAYPICLHHLSSSTLQSPLKFCRSFPSTAGP